MNGARDFFWGNKTNLAQSIVDGAIKSVFGGLVVAGASIWILGQIEEHYELVKKRAALTELRNSVISVTLESVSKSYADLSCARQSSLVTTSACKTNIDAFISVLRGREDYLIALMPADSFSSIGSMISASEGVRKLRKEDKIDDVLAKFQSTFIEMIKDISGKYS